MGSKTDVYTVSYKLYMSARRVAVLLIGALILFVAFGLLSGYWANGLFQQTVERLGVAIAAFVIIWVIFLRAILFKRKHT